MAALNGIGYVVVSIAVFDVSKYLIEEEVIRGREMRVASEDIFRVSRESVPDLPYPAALLLSGILLVVGLGIYQRLSASVEGRATATRPAQKHSRRRGRLATCNQIKEPV